MDRYTQAEFEGALQDIIESYTSNVDCVAGIPVCHLVVGQPGAGKTSLVQISMKKMNKNAIYINGDDYRKFHPHFKELSERFRENSVYRTQKFAAQMTEALIDELSNRGYNLISGKEE